MSGGLKAKMVRAMPPGRPMQALTVADRQDLLRRTVLTDQMRKTLLSCQRDGMFEKQGCDFAGVHYAVYKQWKKWAISGVEPYTTFFREIQQIQQDNIRDALTKIREGDKEWKAAAWWLDHRHPEWREDNTTDEIPPGPEAEHLAELIKAKYNPDEIETIVRSLLDQDPFMPLLGQGDVHDDQGAKRLAQGHPEEPEGDRGDECDDPGHGAVTEASFE